MFRFILIFLEIVWLTCLVGAASLPNEPTPLSNEEPAVLLGEMLQLETEAASSVRVACPRYSSTTKFSLIFLECFVIP